MHKKGRINSLNSELNTTLTCLLPARETASKPLVGTSRGCMFYIVQVFMRSIEEH